MTLYNGAALGLLVALGGLAALSAYVVMDSISEGDAATAWMGAVLFMLISLLDAYFFWRIV
jgi:hypothetical protein